MSTALPRPPAPSLIEIEKKYRYTDGVEERVRGLDGCSFVDEQVLSDIYYDHATYSLAMSDHWLRCRDNTWELKRPMAGGHVPGSSATTYEELTDEADIIAALTPLLPAATQSNNTTTTTPIQQPLNTALNPLCLTPFIHILTTRRTYAYSRTAPSLSIVLDRAVVGPQTLSDAMPAWCYAVVEVEAVVEGGDTSRGGGDGVAGNGGLGALIDGVAERLGLEAAGEFGGKVATYLRRFNPSLLARLVEQSKQKQEQT